MYGGYRITHNLHSEIDAFTVPCSHLYPTGREQHPCVRFQSTTIPSHCRYPPYFLIWGKLMEWPRLLCLDYPLPSSALSLRGDIARLGGRGLGARTPATCFGKMELPLESKLSSSHDGLISSFFRRISRITS
jgi:hypothetical protein